MTVVLAALGAVKGEEVECVMTDGDWVDGRRPEWCETGWIF